MAGDVPPLLVESHEAFLEVIINRPARRNAVNLELMTALCRVLTDANDGGAGAVLLRGAGGFFCSGLDLGEFSPGEAPIEAWGAVHRALSGLEVPVVACLEGGAINAGAALVLGCDLVVAGENAYLQIMEAAMGVVPPMNAAWLALRHPPAVGNQLTLSCRPFSGPDLHRLGIALDVHPDDSVVEQSQQLATRIGSYPAGAGRATKRILRLSRGETHGSGSLTARTHTGVPDLEAGGSA